MNTQPHEIADIADAAALPGLREALSRAPALAVDVETNAMYAYRWQLCFVQIATASRILVVDTLGEGVDPQALASSFGDPGIRKIFHDAQGDLRVLARESLYVRGLFDTQRAATLLGLEKVGLGGLVEARFGVKLAKEHQTADFGQRPLAPELHAYVADDVRYLLPLAAELEKEAREKDIWEELQLDFDRIEWESTQPDAPPRIKLPPTARDALGMAIAEAVDRLRHREAAERNIPVGRVLANAAMGEIAARRPVNERDLGRIPGVKGSFMKVAGAELLAAIAQLIEADRKGELPPLPRPEGRRDPLRREREERLKAWRLEAAVARGVTTAVVLPTPLLEKLLTHPPADLDELAQLQWFGEKRLRLYGEALLKQLR